MKSRRSFLKKMTAAIALSQVPQAVPADGSKCAASAASEALAIQADMESAGLSFSASGVSLKNGRPSLTLLIGAGEKRTSLGPGRLIKAGKASRMTPAGSARERWWEWTSGEHRWRWTLGRLDRLNGFTMKASFTNDPDVTYLKPRDTITEAELRTWHGFVGLLGGTVMISEPLNQPEYQQAARMYGILSPPVPDKGWSHKGGTDRNHEQFGFLAQRPWGDFAVVQLYNVGDEPAARRLDMSCLDSLGEVFHVWSFWDAKYLGLGKDDFQSPLLPPHGPILLRLTPVADPPEVPVLVGSDLHIGMGSAEMENIAADRDGIRLILNDGGAREGNLFIYSPRRLQMGEVRGCAVTGLADLGNSIWKISIAERKKTGLQIVHLRAVR